MDAYEDTEINWRVRRGYGALMTAYAAPCTLALNTQVTLIDHSGARVRIETSQGTLTAGKVIVTVPTNLIADEAIRFHPALPAKVDAARGLPLGLADKVMLALDEPEALPKDGSLRGATMRTEMGSFHLRPFGQPCIEGFFGGSFAQQLEDAGDGALAARSHRRDRGAARLGLPPQAKAAGAIAAGPMIRSPAAPIRTRCRAMPAIARCWRHRSMGVCSLPERRPRRTFSRPRMGRGTVGSGRRGKCWLRWRRNNSVIAGWSAGPDPESRRFRVRCFASPRNDGSHYSITLARNSASGTKHASYFPKIRYRLRATRL